MYAYGARVVVFRILSDGTTEDIFETDIEELLAQVQGPGEVSDLLDEAVRQPLSGSAGGWRILEV